MMQNFFLKEELFGAFRNSLKRAVVGLGEDAHVMRTMGDCAYAEALLSQSVEQHSTQYVIKRGMHDAGLTASRCGRGGPTSVGRAAMRVPRKGREVAGGARLCQVRLANLLKPVTHDRFATDFAYKNESPD